MSCRTGKRRHASKKSAREAMRTAGNRVRVYACRDCGGYHVTSQNPKDTVDVGKYVEGRRFRGVKS